MAGNRVMLAMDWNETAKGYLKKELALRGISNEKLVDYLAAIGVTETKASIDSKISRGSFSASFLLQCLTAIGCKNMKIDMNTNGNVIELFNSDQNAEQEPAIYLDRSDLTRYIDISNAHYPEIDEDKTVISLFSGSGGIDIGLEQAGFKTLVCVDNATDCRVTLKHNRPEWVIFDSTEKEVNGEIIQREPGNIREIDPEELLAAAEKKKGEVTLVVGGAPCQPFSNIGKKQGKDDERNGDLFLEFVRMVRGIEPQAFIFENVAGITQKRHSEVIDYMKEKFKGMDYGISHTILNAANYGVPQRRERFFLIGIKNVEKPAFPLPTHFKDLRSWSVFTKDFDVKPGHVPEDWVTVDDTFKALPRNYKKRNDYAVMNISDVVLERMKHVKQGQNFKVLPMNMRPNCWKNGKHLGSDTFGRLIADLPSVTIRTAAYNPSKGRYIHPHEDRGLNTIEMAAIQGYPYEWTFKSLGRERVTLVSAGKQIGNAVPPPLAKVLGLAIRKQMEQAVIEQESPKKLPALAAGS